MPSRDYMNARGGSSSTSVNPGTTPAGALTPLPPTHWDPSYGGHPATPDPNATAHQAIVGNLGNLGQLYQLAGGVNRFNNQQVLGNLNANLPGFSGAQSQSMKNINSMLAGNVPNDVVNEILTNAAERGISTGGGPNSNAAFLRALGLTSIGLMGQGENALSGAVARTPVARNFDPSSFFVSPEQQQAAALHAATVAGSPIPANAAAAARAAAMQGLTAGAGAVPGYQPRIGGGGGSVGTWSGTPSSEDLRPIVIHGPQNGSGGGLGNWNYGGGAGGDGLDSEDDFWTWLQNQPISGSSPGPETGGASNLLADTYFTDSF